MDHPADTEDPGSNAHVTFNDAEQRDTHTDAARGRRDDHRPGSRARSLSRASSRSSRRGLPPASPYSGIQIEYRTLSIHVSESRQHDPEVTEKEAKAVGIDTGDYFSNLTYHELTRDQVCQQLNVAAEQGLSHEVAAARLQRDGRNTLPQPQTNYLKKLFFYVFGGFCSVLWIGVIVFFICWQPLSDPPSPTNLALAILVLIVILLQACFNAFQDWSTSRTMKSIVDLLPSETRVTRGGNVVTIPAAELVAGDIVHIAMGNKVPADLRLLEHSGDIRFDRSMLTGESEEIEGAINATDPNFLESRNIALMGTMVVNGSGVGVVVLTGSRSVMGRIAQAMGDIKEKATLIQREIWRFVRIIVCLTVVLCLIIALSWALWLRRDHPNYMSVVAMLVNVMGCVVAFIPEGMPIAVSLTLMMVARRMRAANVLPKGLSTVETLGCVNVICSDKTGTLTQNLMSVASIEFVDGNTTPGEALQALNSGRGSLPMRKLHAAAALCNDAAFDPTTLGLPPQDRKVQGNATDAAVLRFTAGADAVADSVRAEAGPRVFQVPFNSKNKWMLAMFKHPDTVLQRLGEYQIIVKGAPDVLLPGCTQYWSLQSESPLPLDANALKSLQAAQDALSKRAERVIMLCEKRVRPLKTPGTNEFSDEIAGQAVGGLTILGLLGIIDPPRAEATFTIAECRRAGTRFFMVTGDYGLTAAAIAHNIGIFGPNVVPDGLNAVRAYEGGGTDAAVSRLREKRCAGDGKSLLLVGSDIAKLTPENWDAVCEYEEIVFARTAPEQKLRIVNEFRQRNNVVAVTGDGVNDAPALRAADVGVAVVTGSDVAIEAADLVLMDRFDSIVDAIRLGRLVFQNLQKVVSYLLPAGSWSEIWPVITNTFFGVPLPLSAFLMIIICVFTDLFLSLSLIMEQAEFDLLSLRPRDHRRDHLINLRIYIQAYLFTGFMETCAAHAMFFLYLWRYAGLPVRELFFLYEGYSDGFHGYTQDELAHFNNVGQCVYFVTLVILQWGNILAVRNRRLSIVQADPVTKPRRNLWLALGMVLSLAIAIFVTEVPGLQTLFGTASVPIEHWFIPIPLALGILFMDEIRKLLVRVFPNGMLAKIAW